MVAPTHISSPVEAGLILGTAGHIDHGKSLLIKALTGVDPDRLAEEKRRGITIELGFARLELPGGTTMGVVDVPGHEKFVRAMVAGASGVDVALLTIAADDGVMPQTREHLAVLELLGVRTLVVALTKIDLVDEEWRTFITDEVAAFLDETPYAGAPIVPVSSVTGAGLDELRATLETAARETAPVRTEAGARMPIDRVFTVKGFGTVVTGTLWSGRVAVGDRLLVYPDERETRVRSIEIHGTGAEVADAGHRVALALTDLSRDEVKPGDFLSAAGASVLSDRFDAIFTYRDPLDSAKPLATGTRVHVAHGTTEVLGRILLMNERDALAPHETAFAQIRLESPLPLAADDHFILRSYSPTHVIGGGAVLLPHPRRRSRLTASEQLLLEALAEGNDRAALEAWLGSAVLPFTLADLEREIGIGSVRLRNAVEALVSDGNLVTLGSGTSGQDTYYVTPALRQKLLSQLDSTLMKFHAANPEAVGMTRTALQGALMPQADTGAFEALLTEAAAAGRVGLIDSFVGHPQASAQARKLDEQNAERLLRALDQRTRGSTASDLSDDLGIASQATSKALTVLLKDGSVARIGGDRYYSATVLDGYRRQLEEYLATYQRATASELREVLGLSRKYAVPLLEYFDSVGVTQRDGDVRTLREVTR